MEFRVIPWSRALNGMETFPLMMAQLTPTEERRRTVHFIGPHGREQMVVGMRKEHIKAMIGNLADLAASYPRSHFP